MLTLAVIGVISAMVLQIIGAIRESAFDAQYQRNAQEIASVYAAGSSAGVNFLVPGDLAATVQNVIAGETVTTGPFSGKLFKVGAMPPDSVTGAMNFLELSDTMLIYKNE